MGGGRGTNFFNFITFVLTAVAAPNLVTFLKFNGESGLDHTFLNRLSVSRPYLARGH